MRCLIVCICISIASAMANNVNNQTYNFALIGIERDPKTGGTIDQQLRTTIPFVKLLHDVNIDSEPFKSIEEEIHPILKEQENVNSISKYTIYAYSFVDIANIGRSSLYITKDSGLKNNIRLIPIAPADHAQIIFGYKMLYVYWKEKARKNKRVARRMNEDANIQVRDDNRSNARSLRRRLNNNDDDNDNNRNHNNNNNANIAANANERNEQGNYDLNVNNDGDDQKQNLSKLQTIAVIIGGGDSTQETKVTAIRNLLHPRDLHRAAVERYLSAVAFGTKHAIDIIEGRCPFCNAQKALKEPWNTDTMLRHFRNIHGDEGSILAERYVDLRKGKTVEDLEPLPEDYVSRLVVDDGDESDVDDDITVHIDWTSKILPPDSNSSVKVKNNTVWRWTSVQTEDLNSRTWWKKLNPMFQLSYKQYYSNI